MTKRVLCLVIFGVLSWGSRSFAAGECDKYPSGSYDRTYCLSKLFVESDGELNHIYKGLRDILGDRARKSLTEVQREWITYRNQSCRSEKNPGAILVDCNYELNRQRTEYLRDRLRECKVGVCREEMIGQKSWD